MENGKKLSELGEKKLKMLWRKWSAQTDIQCEVGIRSVTIDVVIR